MKRNIVLSICILSVSYIGYGMEEKIEKEIPQDSITYVLPAQNAEKTDEVVLFDGIVEIKVKRKDKQVILYEQEWYVVIPCMSSSGFV
ncbi:hypothetical protein CL684_01965 [Candidatus Campbellbacteria bacterium]|nr:hypothetical protein [Candidatus Campbellbacteria bacterium]